jgi:hypothetical protein
MISSLVIGLRPVVANIVAESDLAPVIATPADRIIGIAAIATDEPGHLRGGKHRQIFMVEEQVGGLARTRRAKVTPSRPSLARRSARVAKLTLRSVGTSMSTAEHRICS